MSMTGIKLTHVPYKGMSPAVTDLMGGQIDLLIASAPSILAQVTGEKIRALAVSTATRSDVAPSIRSLGEMGYAQSAVELWWGVLAPANTPVAVQQKLYEGINKALQSPAVKDKLESLGYTRANDGPAAFKKIIDGDIDKFVKLAKEIKLKVD